MSSRAFLKFYGDINLFNLPISLIAGFLAGPAYGLLVFCSFGIGIGFLGFRYFKENEYYLYYNLGWTKTKLIRKVWLTNTTLAGILFLFLLIIN